MSELYEFPCVNQLAQAKYGQVLHNIHDIYVGRSFAEYGEFSEGEIEIFRQIVKPGDIVADIGANIGAHTVYFARAAGAEGAVIAFEPQRIVFQSLCANMALNSITNAFCFPYAVGAQTGTIRVPALDPNITNNFGGLSLEGRDQGDEVDVVTLDEYKLGRCKLIKVDVEGMEEEVLKGCVETIARLKPILYVENDRPEKSDSLIRFIDGLGYKMSWHCPPLFNPNNFKNQPENVFATFASFNLLCLPKEAEVVLSGFRAVEVPA